MKCRIELYLKGHLFTWEDITLPAYNHDLTQRDNDEINDSVITAYCRKLKAQNAKQIERCWGNAFTCAVFESRLNDMEFTDEDLETF